MSEGSGGRKRYSVRRIKLQGVGMNDSADERPSVSAAEQAALLLLLEGELAESVFDELR